MSRIDGFEARLRALFPAIGVLQPQGGETDLSLAHVLQAAALALQAQAGCPVSSSIARRMSAAGCPFAISAASAGV